MHPAALRGTRGGSNSALVMLSALTKLSFLLNTHRGVNAEGRPWRWPLCASSMLVPNLGLQPRASMLGEKRQTSARRCIHRAAIVERSSDQNDNADDCLPTVVSCSCGAQPAPLQWEPVHKSAMFLTHQAQQSGQTETSDTDSSLKIKDVCQQWAHIITQPLPLLL